MVSVYFGSVQTDLTQILLPHFSEEKADDIDGDLSSSTREGDTTHTHTHTVQRVCWTSVVMLERDHIVTVVYTMGISLDSSCKSNFPLWVCLYSGFLHTLLKLHKS